MSHSITRVSDADVISARLSPGTWRVPALGASRDVSAQTYEARKTAPHTLYVAETKEHYRLCRRWLCPIESQGDERIGSVRLAVRGSDGSVHAVKQIRRTPKAARALRHLHAERDFAMQAESDMAGRTLLRSPSCEYLVLPLMAADLTGLRGAGGRGKDAAMLAGMRQVLQDLTRCHALGVAHRDIKPANILHRGTPQSLRLGDFGLAQSALASGHGSGTPHHMAPEQQLARIGAIAGHAPKPADVWGVGATFLDVWVGNPFHCRDSEDRSRIHAAWARWHKRTGSVWRWRLGGRCTRRFARAFARLPAAVRPLMLQLLHPDPAARPSAAEAVTRVQALIAQIGERHLATEPYRLAAIEACRSWALDKI